MILVLGSPQEAHAAFILQKIRDRGAQAAYFNTLQFPGAVKLSLQPGNLRESFFQEGSQAQKIPLADIRAVYWRYFMGIETSGEIPDAFQRDMAYREIDSAIGSLFRSLNCRWVNSPEAIDQHRFKGYQLHLLQGQGLRIPQTLMTNDPDAVIAFSRGLQGQVIYKPVRGGAHTVRLTPDDLRPERLKELAKAPVQFQELVPGVDVRVYLVGDTLFAAEIRSSTLDFREDPQAEIVPVDLPEAVARDCHTLAETLGLVFSGIDVRRTPEGEYVFLEGNPSPMFINFEQATGYPISDRLVDLLMQA